MDRESGQGDGLAGKGPWRQNWHLKVVLWPPCIHCDVVCTHRNEGISVKKYKGREVIDEARTCSCVWKSAIDWGDGFKAAVTLQPIAGGTNMACTIFQPVSLLLPSWTVSSLSFPSPWCWVIYRISLVSEWTITTRFLLFSIHSHTNFIVCWRRSRKLAPAGGFEIKEME